MLDRTNGKLLAANPYVKVNWASGIDMKTGRPIETDITAKARAGEKVVVWPSILGGKNWEPMSFNPQNNTAYANTLNIGGHYKAVPADYKAGEWYCRHGSQRPLGVAGRTARLSQGDRSVDRQDQMGRPSDIPRFSGVLSTGGGLVFSGQLTGEFEAFDADTGKKLWQFQTGSGIEGQPVTWEQDGVQYVAIASGYGGVYSLFSGDTAARFGAGRRIALGVRARSAIRMTREAAVATAASFVSAKCDSTMKIRIALCRGRVLAASRHCIGKSPPRTTAHAAASEQSDAEMAAKGKALTRIIARIAMASTWSIPAPSLTTCGNSPMTIRRASCNRSPKARTAACRNGGFVEARRRSTRSGHM